MEKGEGYAIGLDIGTGSVGWSAISMDNYQLIRQKGKNLIGVRLFNSAETAEERRGFRTTRRRLSRRRWRMNLLNDIFRPELNEIDENFLARLKYSWVSPLDQQNPQLNEQGTNASLYGDIEADKVFHQAYPTIYHLRKTLMEDDQQHDLREVYLAIHHIVKYRGHFLTPDFDATSQSIAIEGVFKQLSEASGSGFEFPANQTAATMAAFQSILLDFTKTPTESGQLAGQLFSEQNKNKQAKKQVENLFKLLRGGKVSLADIFALTDWDKASKNQLNFVFDDAVDENLNLISNLINEEQYEFLLNIHKLHGTIILKQILGDDATVSVSKVRSYEEHAYQLKKLKAQVRTKDNKNEFEQAYQQIRQGDAPRTTGLNKLKTLINQEQEALRLDKDEADKLLKLIELDQLLPVQRSKQNGEIPHQLHAFELSKIIEKQGQYYPFLRETFERDDQEYNKIEQLVDFRIPYYVGPLVDPKLADAQAGDQTNHWMTQKKAGKITPWNYTELIDIDKSASDFIKRMTGTDTYLLGEPALHKASLIYQNYNVLQELNNLRYDGKPLPVKAKQAIYSNLKVSLKNATKNKITNFLIAEGYLQNGDELTGFSGKELKNKLSSFHYFKNTLGLERMHILGVDNLETITELQTVFEDRQMLKRQMQKLEFLDDDECEKLAGKHFTGWGNLSKKLLDTPAIIDSEINENKLSLLDALYKGQRNLSFYVNNMDDKYQFRDWVESENQSQQIEINLDEKIKNLAGSPAIKRGITQSMAVIQDIIRANGGISPKRIYLEFARESQNSYQPNSRMQQIKKIYDQNKKELIEAYPDNFKNVQGTLKNIDSLSEKEFLYFMQLGKDMYTGESLDFDKLYTYDVDHIIPQAMTKDNSWDNKVLVKAIKNREKSNQVLDNAIQAKMHNFWLQLKKANLLSQRKYDTLMKTNFSKGDEKKFIARSLVETRQIIKNVAELIKSEFGNVEAIPIRQELTSDMRHLMDYKKNRLVNDYHHAHDALLIATVGEFMQKRGFMQGMNPAQNVYHGYTQYVKKWLSMAKKAKSAEQPERIFPLQFVVGSMRMAVRDDQVDKVTNPDTGEICWTDDNEAYLRKVLGYKNILVTRMIKNTGKLYRKITVKPKGSGEAPVNQQKSDINIYGGVTSEQAAELVLIRMKSKKKPENMVIKIPTAIVNQVKNKVTTYDAYIQSLSIKNYAGIILEQIPLGQLVFDEGTSFYLASAEYKHNARQLWVNQHVNNVLTEKNISGEERDNIFNLLTNEKNLERFKLLEPDLKRVKGDKQQWDSCDDQEQMQILKIIISKMQDDVDPKIPKKMDPFKNYLDKQGVGWHGLRTQSGIKLSDNAEFIYQSPTGLYQRKVSINELLKQKQLE
ncbi:type II CRISPR RNA-guided endonuclease Cas9 [Weissella kandleri]|uniref:type II CRISPR RNA-guided endonuclease Cas9 n=1 Tax=Weissella kandleri TaxID=1616 RepID=UPI00387E6C3C